MGTDLTGVLEVRTGGDGGEWRVAVTECGIPQGRPHIALDLLHEGRGLPEDFAPDTPSRLGEEDRSWITLEELEDEIEEDEESLVGWLFNLYETMHVVRKNAGVKSRHVRLLYSVSR